jgi:hypothetical protein
MVTKEQLLNATSQELKELLGVSCDTCVDCNYCRYCRYCVYCRYCDNITDKSYCIKNVQLTEDEYFATLAKL